MKNSYCGNCIWWQEIESSHGARGLCRRFPPQVIASPIVPSFRVGVIRSIWPEMLFEDVCGEFRPVKKGGAS